MSLTLDDIRKRIETDLDSKGLQRILDANAQAVERSAGKLKEQVETFRAFGKQEIATSRRIVSVSSVDESLRLTSTPVTLSSDDYLIAGPYSVVRLSSGSNPGTCWGHLVKVTYVPEVDEELRDEVTLQLVQIDVNASAFDSEKEGDWSGSGDRLKKRRELLKTLREGRSPIV